MENIPGHVAFIMDGNRRWAKKHGLSSVEGHAAGAENLSRIIKAAVELGVKVITAYSFSTENWNRPPEEVKYLWQLFEAYLESKYDELVENGVRLSTIGDFGQIPEKVAEILQKVKKDTASGKNLDLVLAMNYGSRDEICRAINKVVEDCESGKISKQDINEDLFSSYLDTAEWGDPDLLIRTSGELRVSNFLLWQLSYSEMYVSDIFWPDFDGECFKNVLTEYQHRRRRWGT
jgi:undecaprenyl diphosphate synthase